MTGPRHAAPILVAAGLVSASVVAVAAPASGTTVRVLRVGSWNAIAGSYRSIPSAVDAANPGD
jgi:hypothetical protein